MYAAISGIGAAMIFRFIQEGAKVIVVDHTQDRLDEFVRRRGKDEPGAVEFDIRDSKTWIVP